MKATNSYKKYFNIMEFIDSKENEPVSVIDIANHIELSRKQTIRCVREIAEVNERYELTKIGRTIAIKRIKDV